jgi:hypothetical protein
MQSGSFQGRPYQILMTDIQPNHVALVAEPRVAGAMVGDSMPRVKRSFYMASNDDMTPVPHSAGCLSSWRTLFRRMI